MFPVRILHGLPRYGGNGGLAHALVLNRAPGEPEEAAAAELRFARLFNSAPIAIATVDREGTISTTNAAFVRLFGRAVDGAPALESDACEPCRCRRRRGLAQGTGRGHRRSGPDPQLVDIALEDNKELARLAFIPAPSSAAKGKAKRRLPTPST